MTEAEIRELVIEEVAGEAPRIEAMVCAEVTRQMQPILDAVRQIKEDTARNTAALAKLGDRLARFLGEPGEDELDSDIRH